jgi:hypothetical protein
MKYERTNGRMHYIKPTNLNKTMAEMIDDHLMKIYELMKHVYPEMVGYTACCHEEILKNGELDIHTKFYMERTDKKNEL